MIVEITDNGRRKRHVYPISDHGELMTHRLRRLLNGRLGHIRGDYYTERHEICFVGLVWQSPYVLLREITQDRLRLQEELMELEGPSWLTEILPIVVPDKASDAKISALMLQELGNRAEIKARIQEAEQAKAELTELAGGWL